MSQLNFPVSLSNSISINRNLSDLYLSLNLRCVSSSLHLAITQTQLRCPHWYIEFEDYSIWYPTRRPTIAESWKIVLPKYS